ncbi:hypothetical protein RUND412_001731 [Rhizina undulata]
MVLFTRLVPSCYGTQQDSSKWALVDFHPKVPEFLQNVANDKTESQRLFLEMEDRNLTIDVKFYGFTQLYDVKGKDIVADIVTVTGLGGHAYGSWRGKQTKKMWFQDFLAQDFPNCRTMIYGYNSNLKSRGFHTLADYKLEFLKEIAKIGSSDEEIKRPVIFIGHSFDRLVIAQSEKDTITGNQDLVASTCVVIFFGTPHRRISMKDVQKMLEDDNYNPMIGLLEDIENEMNLEPDLKDFIKLAGAEGFKIVSFYERLQIAEVAKVNSDHTNIVKFDHKNDATYENVVKRMRKYLDTAIDHVTQRFRVLGVGAVTSSSTLNTLTSPFQEFNVQLKLPFQRNHNFCGRKDILDRLCHIPEPKLNL